MLRFASRRLNQSRIFRFYSSNKFFSSHALETFDDVNDATAIVPDGKQKALDFRNLNQIRLKGNFQEEFLPMTEFSETPFLPQILRALSNEGYVSPTPTQSQSWPIALAGRDIISVARTGSGKTCGFLLPAFHKIMILRNLNKSPKPGRFGSRIYRAPTVLVLAPTRELADQIHEQARKFSAAAGLLTMAAYGGAARGPQIKILRNGVDVVIGTPGRISDLNMSGDLDLSKIEYAVLDEADRMLDMGFEPQIREIFGQLPEDKQCLFFTATWPKSVQSLANEFLKDPIEISIGDNDVLNANKAIKQHIIVTNESGKDQELAQILTTLQTGDNNRGFKTVQKAIVFVSRKNECEDMVDSLERMGYSADSIHGDKSQALRSRVLEYFRKGTRDILVATDVAARGLDVKVKENERRRSSSSY